MKKKAQGDIKQFSMNKIIIILLILLSFVLLYFILIKKIIGGVLNP